MGFKLAIGLLIFVVIFYIIGKIRFRSDASQERLQATIKEEQDRLNRFSGRADGRITEHHREHIMNPSKWSKHNDGEVDDMDSVYIVSYEFEVDGKTYKGQGEGSSSSREGEIQTICYDPSDPNVNCTLDYLDDQLERFNRNYSRYM